MYSATKVAVLATFLTIGQIFGRADSTGRNQADESDIVSDSGTIRIHAVGDEARGLRTTVSLDADDAFLPSVLTMLSDLSGYNIVTGPEVNRRHRISIHLKNTPVEEAVNLVVRAAGLSYEIVGNSFLVTEHDNLEEEVGMSSYLVELQYARAGEMKDFLKDLTTRVQVDSGHNALLISTSPKIISEIRSIVNRLDVPSKQIVLRTRVIEVKVDKVRELGIDWEKLSKLTVTLAERPSDPILGSRSLEDHEIIWGDDESPTRVEALEKIDGLKNIGYFDRRLMAFDITLDYLLQTNRAKLLTDTRLSTMNNRKAQIHIGDEIPFIVRSTETASVERTKVGITVEIVPQINKDGYITAWVKPEESTIVKLINGELPWRSVRTAETTVQVRNKQKIVVAGLLSQKENVTVNSVPFLGDAPFFGELFRHYDEKEEMTDLIIEITPYILDNENPTAGMLADSIYDGKDPIQRLKEADEKIAGPLRDTSITGPTHLALTPKPTVLKPLQYSVGVHELAMGLPHNLQIWYTPWESIGNLRFGMKYGVSPGLALAIGYHKGRYAHEELYEFGSRLGVFGIKSLVNTDFFTWNVLIDAQFGEYNSVGGGMAMSIHARDLVALIVEVTESYTDQTPDDHPYWDPRLTGAVRFRFPKFRRVSFSGGINAYNSFHFVDPISENLDDYTFRPYFNIAYTGLFKEKH